MSIFCTGWWYRLILILEKHNVFEKEAVKCLF